MSVARNNHLTNDWFPLSRNVSLWTRVNEIKTSIGPQHLRTGCRGQRFTAVYTNTFPSKVSRGLDKPNPKLLGQDKTRLEVAVGWISRERDFVPFIRVFAAYLTRDQSKPRLVFSRINGPNVWKATRGNLKVERGSTFPFRRDLPHIVSILFTRVRTIKITRQWKSTLTTLRSTVRSFYPPSLHQWSVLRVFKAT